MKEKKRFILLWICVSAVLLLGSLAVPGGGEAETIQETMRDAVLHESNQISLFGLRPVNPAFFPPGGDGGAADRRAVYPDFRDSQIPICAWKVPVVLEQAVSLFDGLAKSNSPWRNGFLGAYIFAAGAYIFFGTLFELFGFQVIATNGNSVTLPAPLSDVNAAIMLGVLSYLVIFSGAIAGNGLRGIGSA